MMDIEKWMDSYIKAMSGVFGDRIIFIGLQGSRSRGEALVNSDIDAVMILDELRTEDISDYGAAADRLPYAELLCGFISGKRELENWDCADLFQFCHDTTGFYGSIAFAEKRITAEAVRRSALTGACNIYHGCCHNMLHGKSPEVLCDLYKEASFVLQAEYFTETGKYIRYKEALIGALRQPDGEIVKTAVRLKAEPDEAQRDFVRLSEELFVWAGEKIAAHGNL